MSDEGRKMSISSIKEIGKPKDDPTTRVDRFLRAWGAILPVDLDPAGIVWKLENVLDLQDESFKADVKIMAPEADETKINNLTMMLGCASVLNIIYRIVRHFYLLGKKTMNLYAVMQVQMVLPQLMQMAKAHVGALRAIKEGQPIGDGAGPLVAAKLMHGHEIKEIAKDVVMAKVPIEGRTAYVVKAEGPSANLGKPGDAVKRIIEENDGKITTIIAVDAGQRLEGEKIGEVADGVGFAIGPGGNVERFKVEETVLKHRIPMHSLIIREDIGESSNTMRKEIYEAADITVKRIKQLILERTNAGDSIIIAGIGNTIGIGQ
jgi:hypothetical protein